MTTEQLTELGISVAEWAELGPVEKLYLDTRQKLADTISSDDLQWIDLEGGQLEVDKEDYPVQFPCVLIDFADVNYENEQRGHQQAKIAVAIRIAFNAYEDFNMAAAEEESNAATTVKRLKLITQVNKVLHGFETNYSTPMRRTNIKTERRDDGIKVFTVQYLTQAKDDSAANEASVYTGANMVVRKVSI